MPDIFESSSGPPTGAEKPTITVQPTEADKAQPLEIIFSSALAGLASLIDNPTARAFAVLAAPPLGYIVAKLGRMVVADWIEQRRKDAPIRLAKRYIREAERERRRPLSPAERRQLDIRIKQLRETLHKLQLKQVELIQITPTNP